MTDTVQRNIWKMRRRAASVALAFAILLGFGMVATQSARAQTFTDFYNFRGGTNGAGPIGGLVGNAEGNFYGTTYLGGDLSCKHPYGCGTVFKISMTDKETVLYRFAKSGADGAYPFGGVIRDTAGTLYGTTHFGGAHYFGAVFKLSKTGKETVLYSFKGPPDGNRPNGGVVQDAAGNLYGTTASGGAFGYGTVFKLSKTGTETVLHSFAGYPSDGATPLSTTLLMGTEGSLYGVTSEGGSGKAGCNDPSGCGVVYKLSKSGVMTVLHSFAGKPVDGCWPMGTPAMDKSGNLYGTANRCGSSDNGVVWKVSQQGTEIVLHNFGGDASDGTRPSAGVIIDLQGNLYGSTFNGGDGQCSCGTIYELNNKGILTVLHTFDGSHGEFPVGSLMRDVQGTLFGITLAGGRYKAGTVWKLTP